MSNKVVQRIREQYPQYEHWTDDQITFKWGQLHPDYTRATNYPDFVADYNRIVAPTIRQVQREAQPAGRGEAQLAHGEIMKPLARETMKPLAKEKPDRGFVSELGAGWLIHYHSLGEGLYKAGEYTYRGLGADEWADEMALNAATARREANLLEHRGAEKGAGLID